MVAVPDSYWGHGVRTRTHRDGSFIWYRSCVRYGRRELIIIMGLQVCGLSLLFPPIPVFSLYPPPPFPLPPFLSPSPSTGLVLGITICNCLKTVPRKKEEKSKDMRSPGLGGKLSGYYPQPRSRATWGEAGTCPLLHRAHMPSGTVVETAAVRAIDTYSTYRSPVFHFRYLFSFL